MAYSNFVAQLRALGYEVEERGENHVAFRYKIPIGRLAEKEIQLGFIVSGDFPLSSPGGPHVSPRLHAEQSGGSHPTGGIHPSPAFGSDWQYWSRPFPGWAGTDRSVRTYMAFIRHLFDTQ